MIKFSLSALSAALAVLAGVAPSNAGDLGDGGYRGRVYGYTEPYYSGQDDRDDGGYADRDPYRQDGDDDDDDDDDDDRDQAYGRDRDNDDDGDDDDRYTDMRRHDPYAYRHHGSTKDDDVQRYGQVERPHRPGCVQGWQVKRRLIGEGWGNFHLRNFGQGVAVIRATRIRTGRPFELCIDGCTGETLSARPADHRRYSYRD